MFEVSKKKKKKNNKVKSFKTFWATSAAVENSDLEEIRIHDPCDTSEELYQLSYQANWELVTLWFRNIPEDGKDTRQYMKYHIFEIRRKIWRHEL